MNALADETSETATGVLPDIPAALRFAAEPPAQACAPPEPTEVAPSATILEPRQVADPDHQPGDDPEAWHLPPPGLHTTGSQLRHRLVTPESIEQLAAEQRPGLLQRLLRRG